MTEEQKRRCDNCRFWTHYADLLDHHRSIVTIGHCVVFKSYAPGAQVAQIQGLTGATYYCGQWEPQV